MCESDQALGNSRFRGERKKIRQLRALVHNNGRPEACMPSILPIALEWVHYPICIVQGWKGKQGDAMPFHDCPWGWGCMSKRAPTQPAWVGASIISLSLFLSLSPSVSLPHSLCLSLRLSLPLSLALPLFGGPASLQSRASYDGAVLGRNGGHIVRGITAPDVQFALQPRLNGRTMSRWPAWRKDSQLGLNAGALHCGPRF